MKGESAHLAGFAALLESVWMNTKETKVRTDGEANDELCGCRRMPNGFFVYDCLAESTDGLGIHTVEWSALSETSMLLSGGGSNRHGAAK